MFVLFYTHIYFLFYPHPPSPLIRTYACFICICFILLTLCLLLAAAAETSKEDGEDNAPGAARPTANKEDSPGVTWEVTFLYNYFLFHRILCLFYFILTLFSLLSPPLLP